MESQSTPAGRSPIFTLPFTREQLRLDLQNIILVEMRKLRHISHEDAVLPLLKPVEPFPFWDAGCTPDEIGITYEQVSKFALAAACEDYFDYGFYAVTGTRSDSLQWDTIHTWIGAYLLDMSRSSYVSEWDPGEGQEGLTDGIRRCAYICELANARMNLEGGDDFYHFAGMDKDNDAGLPGLSIRQLAMLAGMEEMSLRSYISRKTAPVLEVCKDDRKTYIEIDVAKQWLIDKGRYLPVQTGYSTADIDLSKTGFESLNAFSSMLRDRLAFISERSKDHEKLEQAVAKLLRSFNIEDIYDLKVEEANNEMLMHQLAEVLDLPPVHLKHRAKESALKSEILYCQTKLKHLQQELNGR